MCPVFEQKPDKIVKKKTPLPNVISLCITDPGSEVQAPVIVIGPKDTTVVAGNQATLECVANARYVYLLM